MARLSYILALTLVVYTTATGAASCESGWTVYKDELCIKNFENLLSFEEARTFCSSQNNGVSGASLLMTKEPDFQDFISNSTQQVYDDIWLGGKYDKASGQFMWGDGEALTYTNWQDGYPTNVTDPEHCIQLRPANVNHSASSGGKWSDVICEKRNLVICQRPLSWSLQDAIQEIQKLRKQHQDDLDKVNENAAAANDEISKLRQNLESVSDRVVPIGSIYIEYFNQPSPAKLWPSLTWQDITGTYAGLFFRASGGGSGDWGTTQPECSPRITQIRSGFRTGGGNGYPDHISIPPSGWSELCKVGDNADNGGTHWNEGLQMYTEACEVRPKNQAIKLWKRTA